METYEELKEMNNALEIHVAKQSIDIERLREALQKSKDLIDEKLITDAWLIINDALQQKDSK